MTETPREYPLRKRLPDSDVALTDEEILSRFLDYVAEKGLTLYPAQEEAILELVFQKNVILNTPTGSGKSLVASAMHFAAMARNQRSFYTCPIKALVSEKFFALCNDFGPENVGMMTGDASVNRDAPILCCTAEILSNLALREGSHAPVDCVVMDEFHYYADRERGVAWQIPLLTLPQTTFLLMSATLGETSVFETALTKLTGRSTAVIRSVDRPVPLDYRYAETPLHETLVELIAAVRYPIYIVNFTQRACAEEAQNLMSIDFCSRDEKKAIAAALAGVRFDSPYGREFQRVLRHGIGIHHAGLLPKYRLLVEKLAQQGLLKIISGTDTLGVGVNIPIRTVLFTKLCKYDGEKTALLTVRDFHQISGRAGRKGFDDQGSVVVQAPEHVIENLRLESKAGDDPKKRRKIVKRKPPDKGYVPWDKAIFDRITTSPPESLQSRFSVTHGMLLNVLQRPEGGCMAMARIINRSHERRAEKRIHGRTALLMFRSLVDADILSIASNDSGRRVINTALQLDFSLNQALSLYLVDTLEYLDRDDPNYALDLITLVESILENPTIILTKQLDALKTKKMAEMKAAGVEYEERIAELEKLEYPKPNREFIYDTFNAFAAKHPWVGQENIRPKSIAREMFESFFSFSGYIKEYGLERSEGLLLRYLSDVYKVLVRSVPDPAKDTAVDDIIVYFAAIVRQVDSSLLDEWEALQRDPAAAAIAKTDVAEVDGAYDVTRNAREWMVLVRNELYRFLRALASRRFEYAAEIIEEGRTLQDSATWTATTIDQTVRPFFEEHSAIRIDPVARDPQWVKIVVTSDAWEVEQVIIDPDEHNDWVFACTIDLARARAAGRPILRLQRIGPIL